ncbi:hypothetical protein BGZ82_000963 [Podila clonocystis]|nr:hypothetical protein BGZ82_000963 [Podila clonocystis]
MYSVNTQPLSLPSNSLQTNKVSSAALGITAFCASQDNIRLWNLTELGSKSSLRPFQIIAGHHGGLISNIHTF